MIARKIAKLRHPVKLASRYIPRRNKVLWLKAHCRAASYKLMRLAVRGETLSRSLRYKEAWSKGIVSEVEWWEQWLASEDGVKYREGVQDLGRPLQDYLLAERVKTIPVDSVSIIDVGAGPVTNLGYTYPGKLLSITAVDPLADEYRKVLKRINVRPPVPTLFCPGEGLLERFKPESYDIAYACNSLDHSYDPLLVVRNMLALVKANRFVLLRHYRNEGKTEGYDGLHQWNFDIREDEFIIWNKAAEFNVTRLLRGAARVDCYFESSAVYGGFVWNDWVVCVIEKIP